MANLAGKVFEVQTSDGERWTAADVFESRSAAINQAEALLDTNQFHAVQVIADSDRAGTEIVFEKEADVKPDGKLISIVAIDEAAVCRELDDFYGFDSRRTVGRLMRQYLDEHGLTALELAYSTMHLRLLERNDTLFSQAVQKIAGLQATEMGEKPVDRADALYKAIAEIKDRAGAFDEADGFAAVIKDKGLADAVAQINLSVAKKDRVFMARFALARYLRSAVDWNAKLENLATQAVDGIEDPARVYLDEAFAEILDGSMALMELLGGQPDMGTASRAIARLAVGRCPIPKNPLGCIKAVNDVMARIDLPLTRGVLYDRVAREIASTRPLTREGKECDRHLFVTLLRDLIELAGLEGGPAIAEAVARRARIVLSSDEDLSLDDAVSRVLDLLPHRAVRLGFLLDLVVSPLGQENQGVIFGMLGRIVGQLSSITSFLPDGSSHEMLNDTLESLKGRLTAEGLPESWRKGISEALDHVAKRNAASAQMKTVKPYAFDEATQRIIAMNPESDSFKAGEVLFEEGEVGDRAYLIKSGEVEILYKVGNGERILARLGRGEIFGEMSVIDSQPRMASARVVEDTELAVITRENIEARLSRLENSDMVLRRMIDVFLSRLRGEARLHE